MSLSFDGVSSYARTPTLNLTAYTQLSISMWLNWTVHVNNDDLCLETSPDTNTNTNGFFIDPNSSDGGLWTTAIKTSGGFNGIGFARPTAAEWGHYVFTIDRNSGVQQWTNVYRNGTGLTLTQKYLDTGAGHFGNFQWNFMCRNGTTLFGAGKMAEVSVFPGVILSQNEASALYYGVSPLELRSDIKPYYWAMAGDQQLYGQDLSGQSVDFTGVNIVIDNHPPIPVDFSEWEEVPFFLSTQQVGQILEGSFDVVTELNSQNNATKSISAIINILDRFHTLLNSSVVKQTAVGAKGKINNQYAGTTSKQSNVSIASATNNQHASVVNKFGSITIGAVTQFNEFITVNRSVSLQTFGTIGFNQLATVNKMANIDIGLSTDLDIILGNMILGDFQFNCAISNQCLPAVVKQTTIAMDNVLNQVISGRKDSSAQINIDGSFNETTLGSILHYAVVDICGTSYIQFEVEIIDNSVEFTSSKIVYITIPLDMMIEKVLKIY